MQDMEDKRQVVSVYINHLLRESVGSLPPTTAARVWLSRYLKATRPAGEQLRREVGEENWRKLVEAAQGLGAQALLEAEDPATLLATLARMAGVELGSIERDATWGLLDGLAREVARLGKEVEHEE